MSDDKEQLQDIIARLKVLEGNKKKASEDFAADQALMNLYEKERNAQYEKSRTEYGTEPENLKTEASKQIKALDAELKKLEQRFQTLSETEEEK